MLQRKLPLVGKSFQELGLFGRISYIATVITTTIGAAVAIWGVFGWATDQISLAEKTALWEAESILRMEAKMIDPDSDRYKEIQEHLQVIDNALKD